MTQCMQYGEAITKQTYRVNSSFHFGWEELFTVLVLWKSDSIHTFPLDPYVVTPDFSVQLSGRNMCGELGGVDVGDIL